MATDLGPPMIHYPDPSTDPVDYTALDHLWPPEQWLSRVGTQHERNGYGERPRETGPRGEYNGIPTNEIHGDL